ncbi:MAG: lipid A biosynthesis acyltransferase [Planctomycetes bacterium]|nr:lipid A biosynthesis acyltransferase [Planctomycetota bacterium]
MSRKQRSLFADFLVYLAVRVFICILQCLSFRMACGFARFLALLAYHVDRRHRLVALDNLRIAFPDKYSEAELDALVRAVYRHFLLMLVEIMFLPRLLHVENFRHHLRFRSPEDGRRVMEPILWGRPILLATGHFGNWELSSYIMGLMGFGIHAIARPLDNPFVDKLLRRFREIHGQKMLAKSGDFDQIQEVLKSGGLLGTLADQDAGQRGLYVDFFNRPASTHKAVALLALEHRVPIVVFATVRLDRPMHYQAMVEDVILPEEYENRPDAVKAMTQRYTTALENLVRQYPEQYFWLHRRWKHQPAVRAKKRAAA